MNTSNSISELSSTADEPAPTTIRATGPRHDVYGLIHKGLRSFMLDSLSRLGRVDAGSPTSFSATVAQTRALLEAMHEHLRHENEFIHPALEARSPGSAAATAMEHAEHEQVFGVLEHLLLRVEQSFADGDQTEPNPGCAPSSRTPRVRSVPSEPRSGGELEALLKQLYLRLSAFVAENLAHMYREETETTQLLWRLYSDDELRGIQSAIVASESPEELAVTLRWMLPSVTPKERLGLLGGARQGLPPQAFQGVMRLAEEVLEPADYRQLAGALG